MPWQSVPGIAVITACFTIIGIGVPLIESLAYGNGRVRAKMAFICNLMCFLKMCLFA